MQKVSDDDITIKYITQQTDENMSLEIKRLREQIIVDVCSTIAIEIMAKINSPGSSGLPMDAGHDSPIELMDDNK